MFKLLRRDPKERILSQKYSRDIVTSILQQVKQTEQAVVLLDAAQQRIENTPGFRGFLDRHYALSVIKSARAYAKEDLEMMELASTTQMTPRLPILRAFTPMEAVQNFIDQAEGGSQAAVVYSSTGMHSPGPYKYMRKNFTRLFPTA